MLDYIFESEMYHSIIKSEGEINVVWTYTIFQLYIYTINVTQNILRCSGVITSDW